MAGNGGKMDLGEEKVRELLTKLATDDDVRKAFEDSPATVLEEFGIEFDPAEVPDRAELPPKEEIQATMDDLLARYGDQVLVAQVFFGPPPGPPPPPPPRKPPTK